jgi:glycosyltransferase A (GT-A) superfamily protein (DUF2064 family)
MKTDALLIFIRTPELGKVKTRLAKNNWQRKALAVYNDLLLHTMIETRAIKPINLFFTMLALMTMIFGLPNVIKKDTI